MASAKYNITIEQGATFTRTITWYSDLAMTTPVVLTSYTAAMKVKTKDLATTVLSSAAGTITLTLGGTAGTIVITISATNTAALTPTADGEYAYDLELTLAGVVTRLLEGRVTVSPEVTV